MGDVGGAQAVAIREKRKVAEVEAESTVLHARANAEGRRLEAQAEAYAEKQRADAQLVSNTQVAQHTKVAPPTSPSLCTPWLSSAAGIVS